MKQEVRLKNLTTAARSGLEALVASLVQQHFRRHLQAPESDAASLFATLEKTPARNAFRATLRLELPGRALISREEAGDIESAVAGAFEELEARLRRHLARLRRQDGEPLRPAGQRLPRLEQRLPERSRAGLAARFETIKDELSNLARFVERELMYLRSSGELASDYPTVDDVVDEVLVRALDRWQPEDEPGTARADLLRLSIGVLAERIAEARTELLEGLALDESDDIDVAQAFYYQEQLADARAEPGRFESLMSASAPADPVEAAGYEQTRRLLLDSLQLLPVSWRRIVMLSRMDDQSTRTIAATLDIDEETVEACLGHAEAFLRDRLRQAAIELPDRASPADYLVIEHPFSAAASEIEQELSSLLDTAKRAEPQSTDPDSAR